MKKLLISTMLCAAVMMPVTAEARLKVTNLSSVPQTVEFRTAGAPTVRVIEPQRTEYFNGADGFLSLVGKANTHPAQGGTIGASGVLSGVVGAVRTSDIPASQMDEFVIWPDGSLLFQKRKKVSGR